jgi:hypothetical protein
LNKRTLKKRGRKPSNNDKTNVLLIESLKNRILILENEVSSLKKQCLLIPPQSNPWNKVMNEETHEFYYHNTITDETSWNIPNTFTPGT